MDSKIDKKNLVMAGLILMIYDLLKQQGVYPNTSKEEFIKDLVYLHQKGCLYTSFEYGKPVVVVAMYRIPEYTPEKIDKYPEKEEGTILYIPFAVSISKDKHKILSLLKYHLNNHPEISEVIYERKGKPKRFKLKQTIGV